MGINLDEMDQGINEQDWNKEPVYENHPLYLATKSLSKSLHNLLKQLDPFR